MVVDEDKALEAFESQEGNDSKEWASSFTVDGVPYAASIFWESLQNIDAPFMDAKEAAENVLVGADLFCVKHGKSPQLGLAVSSQGFKKGMNVAAINAVTSMSDASSLLAVFKVDAGYWYLCVRNDVILSDGDVLFVKEEDAKEQFVSMLSVPDWSRKIAPAEWGIDDTIQKDISEIFSQGLNSKLEKINALRGTELLIVVVLSIVVGAWLVTFISNNLFSTAPQENRVITRRAKPKVVKKVVQVVPAPWEALVDPTWFLDSCRKGVQDLVTIPTPGWRNSGVTCTTSSAVTSWRRSFGRLSWMELSLAYSGVKFSNKSINNNATGITASISLGDAKKINSMPKKNLNELRLMIQDLFQAFNLSIGLSEGKTSAGNKSYKHLKFKISSKYDPNVWKKLLTKFSGLSVNSIRYNNGVWVYEGIIYAQ